MDMQLHITGRGLKLTDAIKAKAHDKLAASIAPLCDDSATTVEVELISEPTQKDSEHFECRVHLSMPHEKSVFIHETDHDLYAAIDLAQDRLVEVVKERKDRHRNHHQAQKEAERERGITARDSMTTLGERRLEPAQWEKETAAFEKAQAKGLH